MTHVHSSIPAHPPMCPRCGDPRAFRYRDDDGDLWCICGTVIDDAPRRTDDALARLRALVDAGEIQPPRPYRAGKLGRRQQLIVDYLAQHGPSRVRTVAAGLVLPPYDVHDALRALRQRGLVRETTGASAMVAQVWEVVG